MGEVYRARDTRLDRIPWPPSYQVPLLIPDSQCESKLGGDVDLWLGIWLGTLLLASTSVAWSWLVWFRQRAKAASNLGNGAALCALVSGTLSALLYLLFVLGFMYLGKHEGAFSMTEVVQESIIYAALALAGFALSVSFFSRGKVRITGIMLGAIISSLWLLIWRTRTEMPFGAELTR